MKLSDTVFSQAYFVTTPDSSPLKVGESRNYPILYNVGNPAATGFELRWYANREDADADRNMLTDASRLPTAAFHPPNPNTDIGIDAEVLQNGSVTLTSPDTDGYTYIGIRIRRMKRCSGQT